MVMPETTAKDFPQTVEAEVTAIQRFVGLLEVEQEMLVKGEIDELMELVREKNGVIARLAALAAERSRCLAAEGLAADRAGVSAWFEAHPGETAARTIWASLLSLASRARELNRVNGELIQLRMQHNAQALEALTHTNSALGLYGPDGQNTPASSRRISDSA